MKHTKIISLVAGGIGAGWFFLPTIKMLKWVLPILLFIWISTSVIGCYSKANPILHEKTVEKVVYNYKTIEVPKEVVVNVTKTNRETIIQYVNVTNSITNTIVESHTVDGSAITPPVNEKGQRYIYFDGKLTLCHIKRNDSRLVITHEGGIYTIPISISKISSETLASIPYMSTPETYTATPSKPYIVKEDAIVPPATIKKVYIASNKSSLSSFAEPRICGHINYR